VRDTFDIMASKRAYKKAMSKDEAAKELRRCAGTQFDSMLVEKFIEILSADVLFIDSSYFISKLFYIIRNYFGTRVSAF
jgi:response regulator RpfG family c-di-GMP phosphodiesterase